MKRSKHILFALALALTMPATTLQAQKRDADEAQALARSFFSAQGAAGGSHKVQSKVRPELAYTAQTDGEPDFYVFNRAANQDGFVIVNADETSTSILGYSTSSTFDPDSLPDNMRWWLGQYQKARAYVAPKAARHDVGMLIATTWHQNAPFYNAIPNLGPGYNPFVTGCTATALSQIMKYWEYPAQGVGSKRYIINYSTPDGVIPVTFQADYANTTYQWDKMLNDYSQGYTDAQAEAVATLMYHAGVAEMSEYGSAGTSAYTSAIGTALTTYFDYDEGICNEYRQNYTDEEWDEMIYSELTEGRPIIYSGCNPSTPSSGHTFICHGYEAATGLYAINWGWGGMGDGYFALIGPDALKPNVSGTGGGNEDEGYTAAQNVYIHIQPNAETTHLPIFLSEDEVQQGLTITVKHNMLYKGTFTFSSSNPSIASITDEGVITGHSVGETTITVQAGGDDRFLPTTRKFNVNVIDPKPIQTDGLCFFENPYVDSHNIVDQEDELKVIMPVANNGDSDATIYLGFEHDYGVYSCTHGAFRHGRTDATFKLGGIKDLITPGKCYKVYFYLDEAHTIPMNVPYVTYYNPESAEPTVSELTKAISQAKEKGIKPSLIRALANKILKRF